jgi:hypothetical protein
VRTCNYECRKIYPMNAKPWPTVASGTSRAPTGSEHPKNRARSISQRVTGTKEEPRLREVVARLRIAASFRSMRCASEDASGARELTRGRDKTHIGVFVPVRNSFGVCFHGLGRFLNGGVFRVGFCAEPCAGARTQTLRGACLSVRSAVRRKARARRPVPLRPAPRVDRRASRPPDHRTEAVRRLRTAFEGLRTSGPWRPAERRGGRHE